MGSGLHSLGYFLFEVSNLDAWDHFLTKVIGVERGEVLGEGLLPAHLLESWMRRPPTPGRAEVVIEGMRR